MTELVEEAIVHVAPFGTVMPELGEVGLEPVGDWRPLTLTGLLRHWPGNRVDVVLSRADGSTVADYEAAVAHRQPEGDILHWHVLVAGSVMFRLKLVVNDDAVTGGSGHYETVESTNELILAARQFWLQMHEAETLTFAVDGAPLGSFGAPTFDDASLLELRVLTETIADIVAIESLTGEQYAPCTGEFNDLDRVRFRQVRLAWEGHVTAWFGQIRNPIIVPQGTLPQAIGVRPGIIEVGGTRVRMPAILLCHPEMTSRDVGPAPEVGPAARQFDVVLPEGERFLAWCPQIRDVAPDGNPVKIQWNLIGIDEETFQF